MRCVQLALFSSVLARNWNFPEGALQMGPGKNRPWQCGALMSVLQAGTEPPGGEQHVGEFGGWIDGSYLLHPIKLAIGSSNDRQSYGKYSSFQDVAGIR
jgi:hypothetical protein